MPARDGKITLPNGKRCGVYSAGPVSVGVVSQQKDTYLHRLVAELVLGVTLSPGLHIHHVNGDPRDNRPENLFPICVAEHCRLEKAKRRLLDLCSECGALYVRTRHRARRVHTGFCDEACRARYMARVWSSWGGKALRARRLAATREPGKKKATRV